MVHSGIGLPASCIMGVGVVDSTTCLVCLFWSLDIRGGGGGNS